MDLKETMLNGKANLKQEEMHDAIYVTTVEQQNGNWEQISGCRRLGLGVRGGHGYKGMTPKSLVVLT